MPLPSFMTPQQRKSALASTLFDRSSKARDILMQAASEYNDDMKAKEDQEYARKQAEAKALAEEEKQNTQNEFRRRRTEAYERDVESRVMDRESNIRKRADDRARQIAEANRILGINEDGDVFDPEAGSILPDPGADPGGDGPIPYDPERGSISFEDPVPIDTPPPPAPESGVKDSIQGAPPSTEKPKDPKALAEIPPMLGVKIPKPGAKPEKGPPADPTDPNEIVGRARAETLRKKQEIAERKLKIAEDQARLRAQSQEVRKSEEKRRNRAVQEKRIEESILNEFGGVLDKKNKSAIQSKIVAGAEHRKVVEQARATVESLAKGALGKPEMRAKILLGQLTQNEAYARTAQEILNTKTRIAATGQAAGEKELRRLQDMMPNESDTIDSAIGKFNAILDMLDVSEGVYRKMIQYNNPLGKDPSTSTQHRKKGQPNAESKPKSAGTARGIADDLD